MANEYLQRTPTSTGNRKVFTWAGWVKKQDDNTLNSTRFDLFNAYSGVSGYEDEIGFRLDSLRVLYYDAAATIVIDTNSKHKDLSGWMHVLVSVDTTKSIESDRWKIYINGILLSVTGTYPSQNKETTSFNVSGKEHNLLRRNYGTGVNYGKGQSFDVFFVDGQALTPDVFGYYKKGDGYISAGTAQATDFKRGQWVPKAPKVIKSVINARGGFGVNGFYLPMNDASNFGADFHCEPNSIIKLKGEDFNEYPQPRNGAPTTTDAYVSQLRDDPFKDYLVLAIPGINGGKESGCGDYSGDIKGTGVNKILTRTGSVNASEFSSYYGSCLNFNNNGYIQTSSSSDYDLNDEDFTVEFWSYHSDNTSTPVTLDNDTTIYSPLVAYPQSGNLVFYASSNGSSWDISSAKIFGPLIYDQWNHIAVCRKGSTFYLLYNGVVTNTFTSSLSIYQGSNRITIGRVQNNATFVGKVQDFRFYKGVAKYTSGFDIVKPYTPVGIASWRAVPDTTVNNFATLNPLYKSGAPIFTFSEGNLRVIESGSAGGQVNATMGVSSGKWYYEVRWAGIVAASHITGWTNQTTRSYPQATHSAWCRSNGQTFGNSGGGSNTFPLAANGDIINIAFDADSGKLWFGINGTYYFSQTQVTPMSDIESSSNAAVSIDTIGSGIRYFPVFWYDNVSGAGKEQYVNFGQNPSIGGNYTPGTYTDSNGKGLFKYQPPSGFLALCEDNLPTPAIKNPGEYFKTVLYTGDGNSGRSITGVGFQPDFVWIKPRNFADQHVLCDSIRGPLKSLYILTNSEANNGVLGFNADGFTLNNWNNTNDPTDQFVSWCWKAGGPAVTNTDGSITSQVSVNQDAGFSIVSYTGNNSNATIGHGLGKIPSMVIVKRRDFTQQWYVRHNSLSSGHNVRLNDVASQFTTGTSGNVANLTSSTTFGFNIGSTDYNGPNASGGTYVAYCWAEIEGFSKFGSYVGNLSADGPFVYCGFKPAWVMVKNVSASGNWLIWDNSRSSSNANSIYLIANNTVIDQTTGADIDFLSNGFKVKNDSVSGNGSGNTIIFAAFAESPFKYANSK
jgi:hypothetical protein